MMTSDTNACGLHITETSKGWGEPDKENAPVVSDGGAHGSPGWTRTNNQVVNSHLLCQLSYRGKQSLRSRNLSLRRNTVNKPRPTAPARDRIRSVWMLTLRKFVQSCGRERSAKW